MRYLPLPMALAVLLWGWQSGLALVAVPMAVVVEASRWVRWRWNLSDRDLDRLADFTAAGFLILAVYEFDEHGVRGIYHLLRWVPALLFLLAAAQLYGTRERIGYTALFWTVRRAVARGAVPDPGGVDFTRPYLVVCLVAASAGAANRELFLPVTGALLVYLLWPNRSRRYRAGTWALAVASGMGLGYLGVQGVVAARQVIEPWVMDYFQDRLWAYRDPYRAYTAMGYIGRLKLSDRIVMRVRPAPGYPPPPLLREATYQTLSRTVWLTGPGHREFASLSSDVEGSTWKLHEHEGPGRYTTISRYLRRGKGMVAVPTGTFRLDNLPVEGVSTNDLGALKILKGPEIVEYRTHYDPMGSFDLPPETADLVVPPDSQAIVEDIVNRLELRGVEASKSVRRITSYFLENFRYSVTLRRPVRKGSPLQEFLRTTRTGHCEFFATATVLLLRAAGIPARYATGFAVHEFSELETAYVVRRRHAHSWALAYVGGRWVDVDTTPPVWSDIEAEQAPWWQGGYDLWAWLRYLYARWRWGPSEEARTSFLPWLLVPLVAVLVWRVVNGERIVRRRGSLEAMTPTRVPPGNDSEFYEIERALARVGCERGTGEPLLRWLRRSARAGRVAHAEELIDRILPMHYRYRFDPRGLTSAERMALRERVQAWLRRHAGERE